MAKRPLPTPDELRQLLDYDPEAGVLVWRERPLEMFRRRGDWKRWNTCFAGRTAGARGGYGYIAFQVFGQHFLAHRVAWAIAHGAWPEGDIDHINGDGTDNRIVNLRSVSHAVNLRNMRRPSHNTSGVVGVYQHPNGKFRALIGSKKNRVHLGYFDAIEDAIAARKTAEARMGYHKNHGSDRHVA